MTVAVVGAWLGSPRGAHADDYFIESDDYHTRRERSWLIPSCTYIELELRLQDLRAGRPLLSVRHQSHSRDPAAAALRLMNRLIQFLC